MHICGTRGDELTHWGRQNTHVFADIFKRILLNENRFFIRIALKHIPESPCHTKSSLVQIMSWRCIAALPETHDDPVHWRIYASPRRIALNPCSQLHTTILGSSHKEQSLSKTFIYTCIFLNRRDIDTALQTYQMTSTKNASPYRAYRSYW